MRRVLLLGASRGIGAAMALRLAPRVGELIAVSRGPAAAGRWVEADLAEEAGLAAVAAAVGEGPLDALLFLGGTWERGAFGGGYSLFASDAEETRRVIAVNLVAPLELARRLAPNLASGANPRVVMIGALSSEPAAATPEAANTAAKAGLAGLSESLRLTLAPMGVGVTLINPGNVATPEVEADIAEGRFAPQRPIPMEDLLALIEFALSLSPGSDLARADLVQRRPEPSAAGTVS